MLLRALKARGAGVRRRSREVKASEAVTQRRSADPLDELTARELLALVDEEVERLPAQYDPQMVERALANLLVNAGKHAPDGGRVRVTVEDAFVSMVRRDL